MTQTDILSLPYQCGSLGWKLRISLEWISAKNKYLESIWVSRDSDEKPTQIHLLWQFSPKQNFSSFPHLSQILTIRSHFTMCIDTNSARCWKCSPEDNHTRFPPSCNFPPDQIAVATGHSFKNTLPTQSELNFSILIENNKNNQLTLPKVGIEFSSVEVADRDEPKYQIRSLYVLTSVIISADERYNDCCLLNSTVLAQSCEKLLQIIIWTEYWILHQRNSIELCISAHPRLGKGFTDFFSQRIPGLRPFCCLAKLFMWQFVSSRDPTERRYIYNLVTRGMFCDKANPPIQSRTLEATKIHSSTNGVSTNLEPRIGFGKDQMNRPEVVKLLRNIFAYDDVQIAVYTLEENGVHAKTAESDAEFYAVDEIEKGSEKIFLENRESETDFIESCKPSQPTCDERVPIFPETDYSNQLIDHYIQSQPKDFTNYV